MSTPAAAPVLTYDAFWHRYLRAHSRHSTRLVHYAGTALALAALLAGLLVDWRWLIAAPVVGYGFAWGAHLLLEGNRPETFGHPTWSLASDARMAWLALTGGLRPHLAQAGVDGPGVDGPGVNGAGVDGANNDGTGPGGERRP